MLHNIGMSYTVGKLLHPTFQCPEVRNGVFEYLLPASLCVTSKYKEIESEDTEPLKTFNSQDIHSTREWSSTFYSSDSQEILAFSAYRKR